MTQTVHDGAALIAAERRRQIEVEGYTAQHDANVHRPGQLQAAARAYAALPATGAASVWPFTPGTFKPAPRGRWDGDGFWTSANRDAQVRNLVRAGALLAAEIDLLNAMDCREGDDNARRDRQERTRDALASHAWPAGHVNEVSDQCTRCWLRRGDVYANDQHGLLHCTRPA